MDIRQIIQPIADQVNQLGTPEVVNHWGHPFFMSIVILAMGSFAGIAGWKARLTSDVEVEAKSRADHRKVAPLMSIFLALGYSGGLISLVVQDQPLLESPHFWTGSAVLILLAINALISYTGFFGDKVALRTTHAYVGSGILALLLIHAALGLKLGLAI
ncbi:hypothetical protein Pse7367_1695 [Thalassoporum mexicanum PCC 7367]|uniref:DUF4079 domain-containing protein n=1 Tax=Thalassoporum mexicanum TaxID=3457544 RepID=UPI00029FDE57|nr:DUF4079 domain-containing protein [Pseudanabaena sp. PCC 7367]AFY69981.1 hypothetical protein Pse7367_1695 [Pseudanabaena sp. PCC 7367]